MLTDDTVSSLSFETPTLEFGDGARERLPAVLDGLGVDSPLVVSDPGVAAAGVLDDVLAPLAVDAAHHDATTEPSTDDFAELPTGAFDGVLAVGGGSVLDTAKLVALLLEHGGAAADYLGVDAAPGPVAPLVAVPTTSGTGSQATQTAVVSHDGVKRGVSDEALRPSVAVVDPELTHGLPPALTARSGFDAFVHALESLTARDARWVGDRPIRYQGANAVSRPLSARALRAVWGSLERAVHDGDDREARRELSLGSHLAGAAFSNAGLGAVHALASTVGGMTDQPHGACLAASIETGLAYNLPVRREQYAEIARELGLAGVDETDEVAANALVAGCTRLRDAIGLPDSFAAVGLSVDDVPEMVENTLVQERRLKTNPREVTAEGLETALRAAFE